MCLIIYRLRMFLSVVRMISNPARMFASTVRLFANCLRFVPKEEGAEHQRDQPQKDEVAHHREDVGQEEVWPARAKSSLPGGWWAYRVRAEAVADAGAAGTAEATRARCHLSQNGYGPRLRQV